MKYLLLIIPLVNQLLINPNKAFSRTKNTNLIVDSVKIKESIKPDVYITGTYVPFVISKDVAKNIGKKISTKGKVYSTKVIEGSGKVLINIGGKYPEQDFTVVIRKRDHSKFGIIENDCLNKIVSVIGIVDIYKGKPEIYVDDPKFLHVE